jgi:hypothetical protein
VLPASLSNLFSFKDMTIIECLEDEIFKLPKSVGKMGMSKYLQNIFERYKKLIDQISDAGLSRELDAQKNNIDEFANVLISSLNHYQKGHVESSYSDFKKAMTILKPVLFPKNKGKVANIIGLNKPFYRARIGTNKPYSKAQMFHLPFSLREFANTQRFSIPGLPCLYLSNSIYTCWEELNRPSIDQLQVSRFQLENFSLNILDISLTPIQIKWHCNSYAENKNQGKYDYDYISFWFLVIWPLTLVCSLNVLNEDAPFKHEYIFPQFLLQWVTQENEIDGIRYFSVKSNPFNKEDYSKYINYVFPPKKVDYGDYCNSLRESFKLTDPVSFEILRIADPENTFLNEEWVKNVKHKVIIDNIRLELINGYPMPYTHTIFGKMEVFMQNLEVNFLPEQHIIIED